jgi:cation diffusion facilitator family transporter
MSENILNSSVGVETIRRQSRAGMVVNVGLCFNSLLAALKLLAGILGHSQALLADGINSVSDVIYFIVVKIFVRLSGAPPDREHPYGHHQYESIAALVVGAFVITTGAAIFWDSVNAAFDRMMGNAGRQDIPAFTLWVAVATIVAKIFLLLHALAVSRKTGNLAIAALARDHRNDIFASAGVTAGIIGSMMGFRWLDSCAGAIVAILVAKTGFDILREASSDLMDNVPADELAIKIRELLSDIKDVDTVEEIHAHRFGPYLVANITIGIHGGLSVYEGDRIADNVEKKLVDKIDMLRKVYVHYHPSKTTGAGHQPQRDAATICIPGERGT